MQMLLVPAGTIDRLQTMNNVLRKHIEHLTQENERLQLDLLQAEAKVDELAQQIEILRLDYGLD